MYVCVSACGYVWVWMSMEAGSGSLGVEAASGCELWDSNLGPLHKQQVFLATGQLVALL